MIAFRNGPGIFGAFDDISKYFCDSSKLVKVSRFTGGISEFVIVFHEASGGLSELVILLGSAWKISKQSRIFCTEFIDSRNLVMILHNAWGLSRTRNDIP